MLYGHFYSHFFFVFVFMVRARDEMIVREKIPLVGKWYGRAFVRAFSRVFLSVLISRSTRVSRDDKRLLMRRFSSASVMHVGWSID